MADSKADSWAVPKDASKADPSVDRLVDQRAALLAVQLVVHLAALWVVQRADQWESLRAALKVVQRADSLVDQMAYWTAAVMEINEDTYVERGQISVWWLVICNASDVMGYGRRRPELSNAPLLVTQDTTSRDIDPSP